MAATCGLSAQPQMADFNAKDGSHELRYGRQLVSASLRAFTGHNEFANSSNRADLAMLVPLIVLTRFLVHAAVMPVSRATAKCPL